PCDVAVARRPRGRDTRVAGRPPRPVIFARWRASAPGRPLAMGAPDAGDAANAPRREEPMRTTNWVTGVAAALVLGAPLVVACSSSPSDGGATGSQSDTSTGGQAPTAPSSSSSSSSSSSGSAQSDGGGTPSNPDSACAKLDSDACSSCCDDHHPKGTDVFD